MSIDPNSVLPRHKTDFERVAKVIALGFPEVTPLLPELLTWLQDANWPISRAIRGYLVSIGKPVFPLVREVFAGNDGIWKYWCIDLFVRQLPRRDAEEFRHDLQRLAFDATDADRSEEVDERAREALAWLDAAESETEQ